MRVAVVGGTGTLGRHVVDELRSHGHDVRVLSRHSTEYRVDLTTGEGLTEALAGCDVVVDATNDPSGRRATETLVEGSRRLLAAEDAAGVGHHVCVSIVGCDQVPVGYFRAKAGQERVVERGPVPWTIVRATQFHELVAKTIEQLARWRILPVPRVRLQTVAAIEVARAVADVAGRPARRSRMNVTGPELADARDIARTWRSLTGRGALLLPIRLPGKLGRVLREGVLTAEVPEVRGTTTFTEWLTGEREWAGTGPAHRSAGQ